MDISSFTGCVLHVPRLCRVESSYSKRAPQCPDRSIHFIVCCPDLTRGSHRPAGSGQGEPEELACLWNTVSGLLYVMAFLNIWFRSAWSSSQVMYSLFLKRSHMMLKAMGRVTILAYPGACTPQHAFTARHECNQFAKHLLHHCAEQ